MSSPQFSLPKYTLTKHSFLLTETQNWSKYYLKRVSEQHYLLSQQLLGQFIVKQSLTGLLYCHADSVWAELTRRTDPVSSGPCFVCWLSSLCSQWVNRETGRPSDLLWEFPAFSWHVAEQVCGHFNQQYRASSVSGFVAPPILLKVWSVEWIFYHLRVWRMGHSDGQRCSPVGQVSAPFFCAVLCWSQILGVHPKDSMFSCFSSRRFPWWQYCIGLCCCPCCRQANVMFVTNKHQVKNSSSHSKQTQLTRKGKRFE